MKNITPQLNISDSELVRINVNLPPISDKILALDWQHRASEEIANGILSKDGLSRENGKLLRAGTGTGKTNMALDAVRRLLERGLTKPKGSISPFPILWLTPKNVKFQTMGEVHKYGLTRHVLVLSYDEIKTSMGAMYISWINDGIADIPIWNLNMLPALVVCDEVQKLKNPKSMISRVVRALPETVKHIWMSATPIQRVIDATAMVQAFRCITSYNTRPMLKEETAKILAWIASPRSVHEYSPSAVERLREELKAYIVELKNVRFKFQSKTRCISIAFRNDAERRAYEKLVEELIAGLNRRKGRDEEFSWVHFLVEMQKMQQGAELLRVGHIVDRALAKLDEKAIIIASNFVETIMACERELVERGISPDRIAIVKGGQSSEERNTMVREYQQGKRDIMLFTMRSGGVGVSMHHDRPETKPRYIILPPTWSAIDLVQALGRGHRLTSLSVTEQEILWYGGTIEDAVRVKVELKLKCISKSITAKEQFVDTFVNELDKEIDTSDMTDIVEETRHLNDAPESEDVEPDLEQSSEESDEALTGEGLDNDGESIVSVEPLVIEPAVTLNTVPLECITFYPEIEGTSKHYAHIVEYNNQFNL